MPGGKGFPASWLARAPVFDEQEELILSVETTGDDTPSNDRPDHLQGGDYSAYPFATIQAAINAAGHRSQPTYINIGAGEFEAFDIKGIIGGDLYKFTGTMGTPIGPFTVSGSGSTPFDWVVSGASWTPSEYQGWILEIISGPGAGNKCMIYDNDTNVINIARYNVLAISSVFQVVPFATEVTGYTTTRDGENYCCGVYGSVGKFVFWNLWIHDEDPDTWYTLFCQDNAGAIVVQDCKLGGISGSGGFVVDNVGLVHGNRVWADWIDWEEFIRTGIEWDWRPEVADNSDAQDLCCPDGFWFYHCTTAYPRFLRGSVLYSTSCNSLRLWGCKLNYGTVRESSYLFASEMYTDGLFALYDIGAVDVQSSDYGGYLKFETCGIIQVATTTAEYYEARRCSVIRFSSNSEATDPDTFLHIYDSLGFVHGMVTASGDPHIIFQSYDSKPISFFGDGTEYMVPGTGTLCNLRKWP